VPTDPAILKVEAQRLRKRWANRRDECRRAYDEYVRCRQRQTEAGNELSRIEQQLADAMTEAWPVELEVAP
jgi:hypothetical protein